MAWTYLGKIIREGRSWTTADGVTHPTSWGRWSDDDKKAAGLVWQDDPAPFDNRFWWDANTPKALEDVNEVGQDGQPILDIDGNQVVTLGLKSVHKAIVKQQAGGLLASTDWYVVRKADDGTAIPIEVSNYRAAIRAYSGYLEGLIDGATNHADFVALFENTETQTSAFSNWPTE